MMFINLDLRGNPMIKKIYLLLVILFFILGIRANEWTILIYMAADNGLHDNALADIEEMEESTFSSQADIIVQMDGDNNSDLPGTYRYKISQNPQAGIQSSVIKNLGETNSGSYQTLKSFVEWGFNKYKSSKKALIIWSHANGWSKEITEKGIAPDNSSESFISMSNHEMRKALANTQLDILIYDACNMQTIENLVELEGKADYIIASEATVPVTGLPYSQIFDYWQSSTDIDSLASQIPKIYVQAYRPGGIYNSSGNLRRITASTAKMHFVSNVEYLLNYFLYKYSTDTREFVLARENLNEFGISNTDIDLKELLDNLAQQNDNIMLQNDAKYLKTHLNRLFISYDSSSFDYKVGPATMWFPRYSHQFINNWQVYRNLYFAQGSIGNFLNKTFGQDEIPPFPFEITQAQIVNETIYLEWENHLDPDLLSYQVNFLYNDGSNQTISLANTDNYQARVKQGGQVYITAIDASGNQESSPVKEFKVLFDFGKVYIAPNPLKDKSEGSIVFYEANSGGKKAEIAIYTASGKLVAKNSFLLADDINEHKFPLSEIINIELSPGIYFCSLELDNRFYRTKFAVEY